MAKAVEKEEVEVEVEMWKYIFGLADIGAVKCAIELGIADVLESSGGGPIALSSLSSTLGCSSSGLYRIMRFLVNRRIFKEAPTSQGDTGYQQTPLSRRLMIRGENSMASLLLLLSSPVMMASWHGLSDWLRGKGNSTFEDAHGDDIWSYVASHPAYNKLLNDAMACDAKAAVSAILNGCPEVFDGIRTLVDVGGGNGSTLRALIEALPSIRGINFDLPHVVSTAPKCDGVEYVGGDMFNTLPKADAVFIKWVLHDWGDEECIQILEKCRQAIPENKGKVIIAEAVIEENENKDDSPLKVTSLMLDMTMMAHTTRGRERTLEEWDYILKKAGFIRYTVKPVRAFQSIIEAYP